MTAKRFKRYLLDGGFWFEEYVEPVWAITDRLDKNSPITHIEFKDECKDLCDEVVKLLNELYKENEQLKAQLYCDDEEGVCNICKYHYLVKDDESELGYYNSRCKKGHYECARVSLKYCEDFEKELEE